MTPVRDDIRIPFWDKSCGQFSPKTRDLIRQKLSRPQNAVDLTVATLRMGIKDYAD